MALALAEAKAAAARGEVPVGAVILSPDGVVLAQAGNRTLGDLDPTAHAEVVAIRAACERLGSERLAGCDLYVTLEPCPMCATRSEEHTSELQSLMRISYAVFCLKKNNKRKNMIYI